MANDVEVSISGALFEGMAAPAVEQFIGTLLLAIAQQAENDIHGVLDSVLRNPTGAYERGIQTERQQNDQSVNDSGIIYGPWLEGVGSRNQTTRFKGYFTFRRVTQQLDGKATDIATNHIVSLLEKLG